MFRKIIFSVLFCTLSFSSAFSATFYVPDDFPGGIQDAINGASNGDTIIVDPGTYYENIDFLGLAITLKSRDGAGDTIINGRQSGSVVTFASGEGSDSILEGFTITNGSGNFIQTPYPGHYGGGVYCQNSSPTIRNNFIYNNHVGSYYDSSGGGIACVESAPRLINNTFFDNTAKPVTGGGFGGGLWSAGSEPFIINTILWNNDAGLGKEILLQQINVHYLMINVVTNPFDNKDCVGFFHGISVFSVQSVIYH